MASDLYDLFLKAKAASDAAMAAYDRRFKANDEYTKMQQETDATMAGAEDPCRALFEAAGNTDWVVVDGVPYYRGFRFGMYQLVLVKTAYITPPKGQPDAG